MLVKCSKCGGYIPDISFGGPNVHDCKNHIKSNTPFKFMILSKEEVKLIERVRKEEADYQKMMHEKPTVYTGRNSKAKIRLSEINIAKCDVRREKGDVWCADSCKYRDTCPTSAK